MKRTIKQERHQQGAVIIVFTLSLLVLFGFMALAIDLGRTYVLRTELQNAADAAALAGAKELNSTVAGVGRARARAIAMAAQNNSHFTTPISITSSNLWVGPCPDAESCTMVPIDSIVSDAQASGMTYLRVYISSGTFSTFFARVPAKTDGTGAVATTSTYGEAVAGRYTNQIAPIGVCGIINTTTGATRPKGEVIPGSGELAQFGFRRGVSYDIMLLNPLVPNSDPYLINPVDAYPNACSPSNSSADATAPFVCGGTAASITSLPATAYGNTGISAGKIEAALNSRFGDFSPPSVCNPATTPPDANIRPFAYNNNAAGYTNWITPNPTGQTLNPSNTFYPTKPLTRGRYGVLWSYSRAVRANTGTSPPTPGTAFSPTASDWNTLYPTQEAGNLAPAPTNYPTAATSPYLDSGHSTPPGGGMVGQAGRRVVSLAIIDCPNVIKSGACSRLPVLGIGRFFMQTPADFKGSPKKLYTEFAGLVDPFVSSDIIRLYKLRSCAKNAITDRDC